MPSLPDPTLLNITGVARYVMAAYAATATVLTTACLVLHVVTRLDQRALRRASSRGQVPPRPLFLPLDAPPVAAPSA